MGKYYIYEILIPLTSHARSSINYFIRNVIIKYDMCQLKYGESSTEKVKITNKWRMTIQSSEGENYFFL